MHSEAHVTSDLMTSTVKKVHEAEMKVESRISSAKVKADAIIAKAKAKQQEELEAAKVKAAKLRDFEIKVAHEKIQKECSEIIRKARSEAEKNAAIVTAKVSKLLFEKFIHQVSS